MSKVHFYPRAQGAIDRGTHSPFDLFGYLGETMSRIPEEMTDAQESQIIPFLDASYKHGGGWHDFQGFTLRGWDSQSPTLHYPGDPPTEAVCYWKAGNARIILFDHAWVAVAKSNEDFRICRMD